MMPMGSAIEKGRGFGGCPPFRSVTKVGKKRTNKVRTSRRNAQSPTIISKTIYDFLGVFQIASCALRISSYVMVPEHLISFISDFLRSRLHVHCAFGIFYGGIMLISTGNFYSPGIGAIRRALSGSPARQIGVGPYQKEECHQD